MKKIITNNLNTLIASFLLILLGVIYFKFDKISNSDFLGIIAAIATIYFGILKYRIENDKVFKELFESFNKKYDEDLNDLFNEIRRGNKTELTEKEKNQVIDYFNLCAEEYLWFLKGRIPKKVWEAWKSGIHANLQLKEIKNIYLEEIQKKETSKSYYGLVEELNINLN